MRTQGIGFWSRAAAASFSMCGLSALIDWWQPMQKLSAGNPMYSPGSAFWWHESQVSPSARCTL